MCVCVRVCALSLSTSAKVSPLHSQTKRDDVKVPVSWELDKRPLEGEALEARTFLFDNLLPASLALELSKFHFSIE